MKKQRKNLFNFKTAKIISQLLLIVWIFLLLFACFVITQTTKAAQEVTGTAEILVEYMPETLKLPIQFVVYAYLPLFSFLIFLNFDSIQSFKTPVQARNYQEYMAFVAKFRKPLVRTNTFAAITNFVLLALYLAFNKNFGENTLSALIVTLVFMLMAVFLVYSLCRPFAQRKGHIPFLMNGSTEYCPCCNYGAIKIKRFKESIRSQKKYLGTEIDTYTDTETSISGSTITVDVDTTTVTRDKYRIKGSNFYICNRCGEESYQDYNYIKYENR